MGNCDEIEEEEEKEEDTKNVEYEIIVLSHFQTKTFNESYGYFPSPFKLDAESEKKSKRAISLEKEQRELGLKTRPYKFNPTYIKDEEIEKDNIKKTELFINNSLKTYYEIDKNRNNEIFSQLKTKVQLKGIYILSNKKIFTLEKINEQALPQGLNEGNNNFSEIDFKELSKQKIKIYNNQFFKFLNEIELEDDFVKRWEKFDLEFERGQNKEYEESKLSAIELENNDLIIASYSEYDFKINVYRYDEKNNYILCQKILEKIKYERYIPKPYKNIKKLSGNRFMTASGGLVKIYSLNKKNKYDVILSHEFIGITDIYEIDEKNFIFFIDKSKPNTSVYQNYNCSEAYGEIYDYDYSINKITFNGKKPSIKVLFNCEQEINDIY